MTHRVIVVTGGFQGIGKAIAGTFLSSGDTVVSADLRHGNEWVFLTILPLHVSIYRLMGPVLLLERILWWTGE